MQLLAKTLSGLEDVLVKEIRNLGGENIEKLKRAVAFEGDLTMMYKANLHLRTALRILVKITEFKARSEEELYRKIKMIDWSGILDLKSTFAIDTNVSSTIFTHSKYVAYKAKDAIADFFREKTGRRPNVNVFEPDVKINIRIYNDSVTVSLDSSGESLHRRGYKIQTLDAPLSEVLAAGILLHTDFGEHDSFADPMCGSGTLVTEALMINTNTAPNINREKFGFMTWKNFDRHLWHQIVEEAQNLVKEPDIKFYASDSQRKAVFATKKNLTLLPYGNMVKVEKKDFFQYDRCDQIDFLIMNPPYDIRLKEEEIVAFYKHIGDKLKKDCAPCTAWIFSANIPALKMIGLKPSKKIPLMNGKLDAQLRKFDVY